MIHTRFDRAKLPFRNRWICVLSIYESDACMWWN
jgi:hypothetical protein